MNDKSALTLLFLVLVILIIAAFSGVFCYDHRGELCPIIFKNIYEKALGDSDRGAGSESSENASDENDSYVSYFTDEQGSKDDNEEESDKEGSRRHSDEDPISPDTDNENQKMDTGNDKKRRETPGKRNGEDYLRGDSNTPDNPNIDDPANNNGDGKENNFSDPVSPQTQDELNEETYHKTPDEDGDESPNRSDGPSIPDQDILTNAPNNEDDEVEEEIASPVLPSSPKTNDVFSGDTSLCNPATQECVRRVRIFYSKGKAVKKVYYDVVR